MESFSLNMWSAMIMSALVVLLAVDQCFSDSRLGKKYHLNKCVPLKIPFINKILLNFYGILDRSKLSELKCHSCVEDSCEGFDWKKEDPKVCTIITFYFFLQARKYVYVIKNKRKKMPINFVALVTQQR